MGTWYWYSIQYAESCVHIRFQRYITEKASVHIFYLIFVIIVFLPYKLSKGVQYAESCVHIRFQRYITEKAFCILKPKIGLRITF